MREIVLICLCLQLSYIYAVPTKTKVINDPAKDVIFVSAVEKFLIPETNSLVEIDLVKDFPNVVLNNRQKRNVVEPEGQRVQSKKRRRRRRKKPRPEGSGRPEASARAEATSRPEASGRPKASRRPSRREERIPEKAMRPPENEPMNPPLENILEPSQYMKSRGRPAYFEPEPIIEKPKLSEINSDDPAGLLKVKSLQSEYISADLMQTNKLKADRIKADRIKAKDVVVTSKKRGGRRKPKRRRRVRPSEYIQPGPVFERIGGQRVNSLDSHLLEQPIYAPTEVDAHLLEEALSRRAQRTQPRRRIRKQRLDDQFVRTEAIPQQSYTEPLGYPTETFIERSPQVQPEVPFPEFSSAKVLKKIPTLSEFIQEPSVQTRFIKSPIRQRTVAKQTRPAEEAREFYLFDTPIGNKQAMGISQTADKTSKTYATKFDPWFF